MTPHHPYLLRAFYDWIVDNELTPHLVVDATKAGVVVPQEFVSDGQIVLNIAPQAVANLQLNLTDVIFSARFGGRTQNVFVPMSAVLAIYARENGAGTMFESEEVFEEDAFNEENTSDVGDDSSDETPPQPPKGRPSLKIVK